MKQGGLCAASGEECFFYVNHSGVIRDAMTLLRKRIKDREPKNSGWYEQLFNWSPWLTTLLSALAGPIILLLLMLTIGPCIINRLLTFIREWVNTVQLMVLRSQYQPLYTITSISSSDPWLGLKNLLWEGGNVGPHLKNNRDIIISGSRSFVP
jgi:hypothetical protein